MSKIDNDVEIQLKNQLLVIKHQLTGAAFKELKIFFGYTGKEIGKAIGRSETFVHELKFKQRIPLLIIDKLIDFFVGEHPENMMYIIRAIKGENLRK